MVFFEICLAAGCGLAAGEAPCGAEAIEAGVKVTVTGTWFVVLRLITAVADAARPVHGPSSVQSPAV